MNEFDVLEHINKLCNDFGWTYYRLAQEADVPYSTLTNMMKRNTIPSIPTLERICYAFGISLSDFFADTAQTDEKFSQQLNDYYSKLSEKDQELLLTIAQRLSSPN